LGQRSRKRGRREKPAAPSAGPTAAAPCTTAETPVAKPPSGERSERRNAAVRATLKPIAPDERPWPVTVSAALAGLIGLGNLVAYAAGAKVGGKHPAAGGIILFSLLMIICAVGMWRLRYWAVLGFMGLLAIIVTLFALLMIEASNLLGLIVPAVIIAVAGFLFIKLVRVLSRIQMPKYPGR
jgi:hypothetical protein